MINYSIRVLLKQPFDYLRSKSGRVFLSLCMKYGGAARYKPLEVSLFGKKLSIADSMSFLWQFHDIFFKGVYAFDPGKPDPVILDCGSNIGMSIIYFKRQFPEAKIIGYEPDPDVFKVLKENTGEYSGVTCHERAVWVDSKGIYMERDFADGGHITTKSDYFIPSVRLKDELGKFEEIDLLKLDVEGAEFELMSDCEEELHRVKRLFVEVHTFSSQPQRLAGLLSVLERAGFRYFLENANIQKMPLRGEWKMTDTGMDVQLNVYATRSL